MAKKIEPDPREVHERLVSVFTNLEKVSGNHIDIPSLFLTTAFSEELIKIVQMAISKWPCICDYSQQKKNPCCFQHIGVADDNIFGR